MHTPVLLFLLAAVGVHLLQPGMPHFLLLDVEAAVFLCFWGERRAFWQLLWSDRLRTMGRVRLVLVLAVRTACFIVLGARWQPHRGCHPDPQKTPLKKQLTLGGGQGSREQDRNDRKRGHARSPRHCLSSMERGIDGEGCFEVLPSVPGRGEEEGRVESACYWRFFSLF